MAANMEDILMGGGSDSDDSDDNSKPAAPAPSGGGQAGSQSDLTNRLKTLYASPAAPANTGQSSNGDSTSSVAASALPRGGIQVPGLPNRPPQPSAPAPSGFGHSMPPPAPQPQQQPPPGYQHSHPSNRIPAPLPKARGTNRSAPPQNRMASVPPHYPQQQPPTGYHPSSSSRPPSTSNYPPHHQSASRSSSSYMQQPQKAPQRSSMTTQQKLQMQQQQMKQQHQSQQSSRPSSSTHSSDSDKNLTAQEKKEKEKFLMFTRVLMKYLEQRDKQMHIRAKAEIKECYEKNKNGDPQFKSLTQSMKARLRATVGESYWKKAHDYLEHFFRQKTQKGIKEDSSSGSRSTQPPNANTSNSSAQLSSRLLSSSQAAAMKMPLQSSTTAPGGPVSTSSSVSSPLSAADAAIAAKQKADAEKKAKANERNRKRRAENKRKKEDEQRKLLLAKQGGAAVSGVSLPSMTFPDSGLTSPGSTATPSTIGGSSLSSAAASKKDNKFKKTLKHSSSISSTGSLKKKITPVSKEYNQDMEQLDHAVMIDVKSLPNLLAKEFTSDINLNDEQRKLLYGDTQQAKVKAITDAAARILSSDTLDAKLKEEKGIPPLKYSLPNMYTGWGDKNVVSVRTAWAKVRLPERENLIIDRENDALKKARMEKPMGEPPASREDEGDSKVSTSGDVSPSTIPSMVVEEPVLSDSSPVLKIEDDTTNHVWYNESRASQDPTLALLSEATELYLKSTIEKAISNARLRQNLDGLRLWNSLQTRVNSKVPDISPPSAVIRLGCDVRRQIALAEGNAAVTYVRMEEAISRQNDTYHTDSADIDPNIMILESTSMADLSKKPPLKSAVKNADMYAKRKFEIYGGKHSNEPPLGRVPKQAKVTLQDMTVGSLGNRAATNRARKMNMMASLFS